MLKRLLSVLAVSGVLLLSLAVRAETMDSFTCLLNMHEKMIPHTDDVSCRVAIVEEQDLMVYLIGQEYINTFRFDEAKAFYQSYLNSGYHDGASLGMWTMDRFIYGNKTSFNPDVKRDPAIRGLFSEAASRGDQMAHYVLRGYFSKNKLRVKTMAEDDHNVYAAIHYVFSGTESLKDKAKFVDMAYKTKSPIGQVIKSMYDVVSNDAEKTNALKLAYDMAQRALDAGSSCANLPLSIFNQLGKVVPKDVKAATKLFNTAKSSCWYAEKNSDVAWR